MPNPLFNKYGRSVQQQRNNDNMLSQFVRLKNNPGEILELLFRNGKINQQQYNDLQLYRNNPEAICQYLINNGHANEINNAQNIANQMK